MVNTINYTMSLGDGGKMSSITDVSKPLLKYQANKLTDVYEILWLQISVPLNDQLGKLDIWN